MLVKPGMGHVDYSIGKQKVTGAKQCTSCSFKFTAFGLWDGRGSLFGFGAHDRTGWRSKEVLVKWFLIDGKILSVELTARELSRHTLHILFLGFSVDRGEHVDIFQLGVLVFTVLVSP